MANELKQLQAENERLLDILNNPTQEMCGAARYYILGLQAGLNNDYPKMKKHLKSCGKETPSWIADKTGHITKWDRAEDIWKFMAEYTLTTKEQEDD